MICGARRSGTTSLQYYLEEHPEIGFIGEPELKVNGRRVGFPFASASIAHSIIGEDTGIYEEIHKQHTETKSYIATKQSYFMVLPHVPFNLSEHLPHVKLIFILRNPVDAAYSTYINDINNNRRKGTFEENLKIDDSIAVEIADTGKRGKWYGYFNSPDKLPLLVDSGFYYQQLMRYYCCFNEDQILVLRFDHFEQNTAETMRQIMKFLELDPGFEFTRIKTVKNASPKYAPIVSKTRSQLQEIYASSNKKLFELLGWPYSLWD